MSALFDPFATSASWLDKIGAWDEAKHPRWPSGAPERQGGQFRPGTGDSGGGSVSTDHTPIVFVADETSPGMGHNGGPPLDEDDIPQLPKDRPHRQREANAQGRALTEYFHGQIRMGAATKAQAVGQFLDKAGASDWIGNQFARFVSSLEAPKTLDELIQAKQSDNPKKQIGYDTHHIVEAQSDSDDPGSNAK